MLHLPQAILEQLRILAREARPLEIVGLLAGERLERVSTLIPLENAALDPTRRFSAEPASLVRGLKLIRESRLELCALFHSHPDGPAAPSRTDLENANWDVPMLIVDAWSGEVRAWNLETGTELELELG
ncbi:MAG: M67 family metallopeptidase [Pleurocapsa sp. SU_196_0]|nr:M67 family metallopeptidase [Pleurocapsa sp. SU_196_0]